MISRTVDDGQDDRYSYKVSTENINRKVKQDILHERPPARKG